MTHNGEALNRLRGIRLDELTSAEMSSVLGTTTLTPATQDALVQAAIVSQGLSAQRTYANGNLPIPEQSAIFTATANPLETIAIQPPGTEVWEIKAIRGFGVGGSCTTSLGYEDGANILTLRAADTIAASGTGYDLNTLNDGPIELTNSLYITVQETGGAFGLIIMAAYNKVSQ